MNEFIVRELRLRRIPVSDAAPRGGAVCRDHQPAGDPVTPTAQPSFPRLGTHSRRHLADPELQR
ncbi:MAG: hypothetical protein M3R48_07530 [Candidatus Dormibacteraeota bacterium]|nr:hypothetical protein [Candidatus Dormibacteraeota bacterium]